MLRVNAEFVCTGFDEGKGHVLAYFGRRDGQPGTVVIQDPNAHFEEGKVYTITVKDFQSIE
jgi:hypothetical protein